MKLEEIPENEYHADKTRISASMVKMMHAKTPAHVYDAYFAEDREQKDTPAMAFGRMVHAAILEPEKFDDKFMVMPEGLDRRTKEGKDLWADIQASGKSVVKHDEFNSALKMAASVHSLPIWADIISNSPQFEVSVRTKEKRARMDTFVPPCARFPDGLIVDLKSTVDASPFAFGRDLNKLGYHLQAAFYCDLVHELSGRTPEFLVIAVEKTRPFIAKPYMIGPGEIEIGRKYANAAYSRIVECLESGCWPAYGDEPEEIALPNWAYSEFEDNLEITTEDE